METLSQLVEESNSSDEVQVAALNQDFGKEKLKKPGRRHADSEWAFTVQERYNRCCVEMTATELEAVKDDLGKLKLDVASLSAEKSCAEKDLEAINSKMCSSLRSLETLQREIDEANEEQVLVELARIEAIKECKSILGQKEKETKEFSAAMERTKEKIKELKAALAHMMADNEQKLIHGNDKNSSGTRAGFGKDSSLILQEIREELVSAKMDSNSVREEGFQLMDSIDITRDELKQAKEEILQVKRARDKTDSAQQLLNSKLLRAKAKLKEALLAEEKTKSVASGMTCTLEQLKSESEEAKKERKVIGEEAASIRAGILELDRGIDLRAENFEAAIEELEEVKLSEEIALENLRAVAGITTTERASSFASRSQGGNPSITLSKFEYEYLKGRAGAAEEVADKKAAAAQAWVEALKASEKEMLMRIEMGEREIRKIVKRQELRNNRPQKSHKSRRDGSFQVQAASPRKAMRDHGYSMTPVRRTKLRNSTSSPAGQPMGYAVKKRRRAMPRLAKLLAKSSKKEAQDA